MSKITLNEIRGSGIPLRGTDIDTDRIIPARFLKCVTFDGIGEHAFEDDIKGIAAKGGVHSFADARFRKAAVLVANRNFGCGSSREHAPQSLKRWGVSAIIAESYSEIFHGNCVSIAVPCFIASQEFCSELQNHIEANPSAELVLSVKDATVSFGGRTVKLSIDPGAQGQFLDGSWDARSGLLENLPAIRAVAARIPYLNQFGLSTPSKAL